MCKDYQYINRVTVPLDSLARPQAIHSDSLFSDASSSYLSAKTLM